MIRLKSLIEQKTNDETSLSETPNVLFLGDAYTQSKSSYAQKLLRAGAVDGRVVAWPRISVKQLIKLTKRYLDDSFTIVSVMFGDIVKQEKDLNKFRQNLDELRDVATKYGAKLVVVQNPNKMYQEYSELISIINEIGADLVIRVNASLDDSGTQSKIANTWSNEVSNAFQVQVNAPAETDDSKPADGQSEFSSDGSDSKVIYYSGNSVAANYSDSVLDQAYAMILGFEAFTPIALIDADGFCRIGHGSSHITKANGSVIELGKPDTGKSCAETYSYKISEEDAHRDLRRLIKDVFVPGVELTIRKWRGDVSKLNDATIAVLTSVMYNYGHIPSQLKPSIAANDMQGIGNMIKTLPSNARRRKQEGNYILNSLSDTPGEKKSLKTRLTNLVSRTLNVYSPFGQRKRGMHYGIDYSPMPPGSKIYITKPGVVNKAGNWNPTGWGNAIIIDHEDGTSTLYAHLSDIAVSNGDKIDAGTYIGATGGAKGMVGAGNSEGPHLHWEYHPGGFDGKSSARDGESVATDYFAIV